jgi:hypothetical protein
VNALEQALLYATTAIVLAGTLVVFVVQYIRRHGRHHDD